MKKLLAAISFIFLIASCKKDMTTTTDNSGGVANTDVNTWIYQTMNYYYLWSSNMPKITSTNLNDRPMNYFYTILNDYGNTEIGRAHV